MKPVLHTTTTRILISPAVGFTLTSGASEHIREDEQTMASEDISVLAPLDFPSGSNWGAKEVEAVRFKTEPEKQDFQSFTCEGTLSSGDAKVLARFSNVFEVPVGRYQDKEYIDAYTKHKAFYDQLTAVLEPKPMSDSPSKPPTRSEGRYNTSSPFTDQGLPKSPTAASLDLGSPDNSPTAGVSKRKVRIQTTTPPSRKVSRLSPGSTEAILPELLPEYLAGEASPGLSEGEQGVTMDQSLSTSHTSSGQLHPDFDNSSSTSNPEPGASSSQSSSFHSPSSPTLPLETRPDADLNVLENEVVELFLRFLDSICAEHDGRDGIKFTPDYGKDLVVMIDGSMVHTRPDLTVSVIFSGQKIQIPILDYEVRAYSQLCITIITIAG